jgi:hypothetical protein
MGHSVHLIIGKGEAVAAFLRQWPGARAVELREGWQAIPVDEALHTSIEAKHPGAVRPPELDVSPFGLEGVLAAAAAGGGGLAYVETEYFGGTGGQSATAFVDGREAMAPQRARGGGGAINQALRSIGVMRTEAADEFDTVGLGERRQMDDYEPEGPVRLRAAKETDEAVEPKKAFVPMWQVMLVIAAAVAVGVFIAAAG